MGGYGRLWGGLWGFEGVYVLFGVVYGVLGCFGVLWEVFGFFWGGLWGFWGVLCFLGVFYGVFGVFYGVLGCFMGFWGGLWFFWGVLWGFGVVYGVVRGCRIVVLGHFMRISGVPTAPSVSARLLTVPPRNHVFSFWVQSPSFWGFPPPRRGGAAPCGCSRWRCWRTTAWPWAACCRPSPSACGCRPAPRWWSW